MNYILHHIDKINIRKGKIFYKKNNIPTLKETTAKISDKI